MSSPQPPAITLAHLSDLHFGTEDWTMAAQLLDDIAALRPRLTVVSGGDALVLGQPAQVLGNPRLIDDLRARLPQNLAVVAAQ